MFAKRQRTEISFRVILIATVLFNALIPISVAASSVQKPENVNELPAFSHPTLRIGRPSNNDNSISSGSIEESIQRNNNSLYQTANCLTSGDLVIANGETCSLEAGTYTYASITVQTGGTLIIRGNPTLNQGVTINATNLTVAAGGKINASGAGYVCPTIYRSHGAGPGAGQFGTNSGDWWRGGGGGGYGGNGQNSSGAGGLAYGSATNPTDLGSSGGTGTYHYGGTWLGGTGGGALHLNLSGMLTVNGEIAADGNPGTGYSGYASGGGGSGGSIWIETNTLTGNGTIHANGGWREPIGGSGGGGRIAVYAENSNHTITFSASGGPGYEVTGKGTIYFGIIDPVKSSVEITPSQLTADGTSAATLTVTVRNTDDLPIPNKAVKVSIVSGNSLVINGSTIAPNEYFSLGNTNSNGIITATLTTNKSGERTIAAQAGQESIIEQGVVEFLPGGISASVSNIDVSPSQVPADGSTPGQVTVTVRDVNGNPIPGVTVTLQSSGSAVATQSSNPTNSLGKVTGQVVNSAKETVTITAKANDVDLIDVEQIVFKGADLSATMTAPTEAPAGTGVQYPYTITIKNSNYLAAQNVTIVVTLPSGITYVGDTSNFTKTQNGQTLSWNADSLGPGGRISFTLYGKISASLPIGASLSTQITVSTNTTEDSLTNNSATVNTSLIDGYSFGGSISPVSQTLGIGANGSYEIMIQNTGLLVDGYDVSITGLDAQQYTLSQEQVVLLPQETGKVTLSVHVNSCAEGGSYPFTLNIASQTASASLTRSATAVFQASPTLSNLRPENGTTLGSRDVTVSWSTDAFATGTLTVYPIGQPQNAQTYQTANGASHSVVVPNLNRNTTYQWYVTATSPCGTTTSATQQFNVGNGVVFQSHLQSHTINRDYDQLAQVWVTNQDNKPHEIQVEVQDLYDDLIVNFRGSGSLHEKITLLPGESRPIELAIFAQDAQLRDYSFSAVLTSDDGANIVTDLAIINVHVLFEADYTIEEISTDILNTTTYRVTNHGRPITDLYIRAVDPVTDLPAPVYITPQIVHARLGTGESLEFKVIPLYSNEGSTQISGIPSPLKVLASPTQADISDGFYDLLGMVGNVVQRYQAQKSCNAGRSIYPVTISGGVLKIPFTSWYCTNRPNIDIAINLPPFLNSSNILGATLEMGFSPVSKMRPHETAVGFNGQDVATMENQVPNGSYRFDIDPSGIATNPFEGASQTISLRSTHNNNGGDEPHHVSQLGGALYLAFDEVTIYVCASSPEEAESLVREAYGFVDLPTSFSVDIRKPATTGTVQPEEDGSINLQAYMADNGLSYANFYRLEAEVKYLDVLFTPEEKLMLFDDGITEHGDSAKNDRFFNALWIPKHGGNIQLTVTATMPDGRVDTDVMTFNINALPDLAVTRVYIEEVTLLNNNARVRAEITNLGFTATGPINVDFIYYATDANGNKVGNPIHTSHLQILTGQPGQPIILTRGSSVEIEDILFTADELSLYFVEVVVDP